MHELNIVLGLLVVVASLVLLSRRLSLPYPILLVVGGLVLGFVPGLPRVHLRSDVVLVLFLPPLLYSDAWFTSWRDFRDNVRTISLLAIGLVITTSLTVAAVVHAAVPGLTWGAALVLGAVVAPTDAVAAGEIAQRVHLPRRIVTVIAGESLVNDASALVLYSIALSAVVAGSVSPAEIGLQFLVAVAGGTGIGLAVGWVTGQVLRRLDDPPVENTLGLLVPYAAYLLAEAVHLLGGQASGVLAVVTAGLLLGHQQSRIQSSKTRLQASGFWEILTFLLNGLLFVLVGLQLHGILQALSGRPMGALLRDAMLVSLTVILARILWVFPATYLPRLLSRRLRARDPVPPWQYPAVLAWSGMRGGISLAAALAIPLAAVGGSPFPQRDLLVFLTFGVILATLVLQGLSLPWVVRRLGLHEDGETEREENAARLKAAEAATARLEELGAKAWVPEGLVSFLREHYTAQERRYCGRYRKQEIGAEEDRRAAAYSRVKRELIDAQREAILRLRDDGTINDEALSRVQHDLDLEELRLEDVAEDALPAVSE